MSAVTTATHDKLLKEYYAPLLVEQFYKETPLLSRVYRTAPTQGYDGRRVVMPAHYARSEGVGTRGENVALPSAQSQSVENMYVSMKNMYGSIKLSGQVVNYTSSSKGAFVQALTFEMEGIRESMKFDLARQIAFGDGTGKLALANGAGAATTALIVDNPGVNHLRVGMVIDVYTSGGTQEVNSVRIDAVNTSTNTVTLATAQTWSDNAIIYREDTRNNDLTGLAAHVDDGTAVNTYQGLSRTANPWLKANVLSNSNVLRPLTLRLVDDGYLAAQKSGGGGYPDAIYSDITMGQAYADLVRTDRKYGPEDMTLDGGFRAVKHTGAGGSCPWFSDRMVNSNRLYFPVEKDFVHYVAKELSWFGEDQGQPILRRAVDGTDAYEAKALTYQNLASRRCSGHTLLSDLSPTTT